MTIDSRNELAKKLKQRRLLIPLTLSELATKSGVSASHLGRVERGERFPSGHILRKIARPLGVEESLLMTMAGYLPEPSTETGEEYRRQLDPYVAKVLSEEPVHVQRTMVTLFIMLKRAIAESLKQD